MGFLGLIDGLMGGGRNKSGGQLLLLLLLGCFDEIETTKPNSRRMMLGGSIHK